jgi:hypothetical protein
MSRTLLAVLAVVAMVLFVLGSGEPAQAVTRAECSIRHAICMDGCQKDRAASVAAIRDINSACSKRIRVVPNAPFCAARS